MNLKEVTKYAIDVARNGFQVSQFLHDIIDGDIDAAVFKFRKFPEAGKVMLKNDGSTYKLNDTIKFPELAKTIETIAENGIEEFYTGKFADLIVNDMNTNGGLVSKDDLKNYKPIFREPTKERSSKGYWKGFHNDADRRTMRYDILGVTPKSGQWKWKKEVAFEAIKNYQEYEKKFSKLYSLEKYWLENDHL